MNGPQSLILRAVEFSGVGNYGNNGSFDSSSTRNMDVPTINNESLGFRPALYISL